MRKSLAFKRTALFMRQVLGRCKASKANDVVAYFEVFTAQQMPKNWCTRKK